MPAAAQECDKSDRKQRQLREADEVGRVGDQVRGREWSVGAQARQHVPRIECGAHGSGDPVKAPAFREHEAREHDAEKDQQAQRQRQLAAPGQILRPE